MRFSVNFVLLVMYSIFLVSCIGNELRYVEMGSKMAVTVAGFEDIPEFTNQKDIAGSGRVNFHKTLQKIMSPVLRISSMDYIDDTTCPSQKAVNLRLEGLHLTGIYDIQKTPSLTSPQWTNVGNVQNFAGSKLQKYCISSNDKQVFFRILKR